ncbi:hypothetical protein GMDG_03790 [Pseudogymnoascus destructans 20631-21]|uniref:Helitron helicase-like domain-containing protein n=1 Tax=Pseudogymnoascus destructans (strain ATCC MYA-4855 / 20631-21) TaxID=658429 RepID=L8GB19_PSED2|nr:hypothetical protein GMDG_03790 [Pseudogymnoascus destructans 20631-21]
MRCAIASPSGAWSVTSCADRHYVACRSTPFSWSISDHAVAFPYAPSACPHGTTFVAPASALENAYLAQAQRDTQRDYDNQGVFVAFNSAQVDGCWVIGGADAVCPYDRVTLLSFARAREIVVPTVAAVIILVIRPVALRTNRLGRRYTTCTLCSTRRSSRSTLRTQERATAEATAIQPLTDTDLSERRRRGHPPRQLPTPIPLSPLSRLRSSHASSLALRTTLAGSTMNVNTVLRYTGLRRLLRAGSMRAAGDVDLPPLRRPPVYLRKLFTDQNPLGRAFRKEIREYNNTLAFTSGPLQPTTQETPAFAQLFFYDPSYATEARRLQHPQLDGIILMQLLQLLTDHNPFIAIYKTAQEQLTATTDSNSPFRVILNPQMRQIVESGADKHRENLPTSDEIAAIIPDELGTSGPRDLVLAFHNPSPGRRYLSKVHVTHASYMPLHYVLLFVFGEYGWHWGLTLRDNNVSY